MTRKLADDDARCPGYELDDGTLRDGCEDCLCAELIAAVSRCRGGLKPRQWLCLSVN